MNSFLQEITMLPGVSGCFVYTGKQKLVAARLPRDFELNGIRAIGNLLSRILQIGSVANLSLTGMEFNLEELLVIVSPLKGGSILVVICKPEVNKPLLTMTTSMLTVDIQKALDGGGMTKPRKMPPSPPPQPSKEGKIDENLAVVLGEVKNVLAMVIGPIASLVMKDTVKLWAQEGPTVRGRLSDLYILLCREINEKELEKEFMTAIRNMNL